MTSTKNKDGEGVGGTIFLVNFAHVCTWFLGKGVFFP